MRLVQLVVVIAFVVAPVAWAGDQGKASPITSATATSLPKASRQLVRSQAEVKRLRKDLRKQESESQRASERLQEQDQAIADMRKQLQELQAQPAAEQH